MAEIRFRNVSFKYSTPLNAPVHRLFQIRRERNPGNFVDAATARAWGLVLDVLPPEELMPFCRKLAAEIASCDRATLADIRQAIDGGLGGTLEAGLELEGRLSQAATRRMDRAGFAATRAAVMSRGKEQSG